MIYSVTADKQTFRPVEFTNGFNVVLAERTQQSTRRDSRNGVGKTTLIEVIHFCLGSRLTSTRRLAVESLKDWTFSLSLDVGGREHVVSRQLAVPNQVRVARPQSDLEDTLTIDAWTTALGRGLFGLVPHDTARYQPTFRQLISYVIRLGRDAYSTPFEYHRKQPEIDRQLANAFLLGLEWSDAADWQVLKDRKKLLDDLERANRSGLLSDELGTAGALQAERVRADGRARALRERLTTFRVHPEYRLIQDEADALTQRIHETANANVAANRLLASYFSALDEEAVPDSESISALYASIGIELPGVALRRLEDAEAFHASVIANRRQFLGTEIQRLQQQISRRDLEVQQLSEQRAELLSVLQTHGALDEYASLQARHARLVSDAEGFTKRLESLRKLSEGRSDVAVQQEIMFQRAETHLAERMPYLERAIDIFNSNSEALYQAPGNLIVDVKRTGFRFDVEILRSKSQGVSNMKVFCYDLMLAELWAERSTRPGFLIHDSTIFDGVDERQVAVALELAERKARDLGFQYICMLNSDAVPYAEFSAGFDVRSYVRLELTDRDPAGSLLGIRF